MAEGRRGIFSFEKCATSPRDILSRVYLRGAGAYKSRIRLLTLTRVRDPVWPGTMNEPDGRMDESTRKVRTYVHAEFALRSPTSARGRAVNGADVGVMVFR